MSTLPSFYLKGGLCFCRRVILWSRYFSAKLCSARSRQTTKCRIRKVDKTGRIQYQDSITLWKYGPCAIVYRILLNVTSTSFIPLYILPFLFLYARARRKLFLIDDDFDILLKHTHIRTSFQRFFPLYIKTFQSRLVKKTSL